MISISSPSHSSVTDFFCVAGCGARVWQVRALKPTVEAAKGRIDLAAEWDNHLVSWAPVVHGPLCVVRDGNAPDPWGGDLIGVRGRRSCFFR
ncbi:hypothetical protein Rru_A0078 [Rhodospirillum rubrum ATCC 11170]|uniref:Uncharacterized protein n=1 Tax=Rhodospirillum rubrum (strain ATCC 11170 / ATH 1.1.1 / DSM 467 / LMG 4362 / NCIMB 8255 / S1) TaxID=269796 RepID=Q2RYB2_RHORT|nr:hypothetical protein Rru_A0078 [Rhodospirillum rubrum ATCC 11170]MBK5952441.1 hypothetical protein [Rhodospirillum rubrum]HAP99477.1 hypothetical protein [Rhodospirillum rubrum]HCF19545.1 hypothetical protein [Rhodospirillum rubrum]